MNHQKNLLKSQAKPRMSAKQADYEELQSARKDGECTLVEVPGGISKEKGCCAEWERVSQNVKEFRCGTCTYEYQKE